MKKSFAWITLCLLFLCSHGYAQRRGFGIGIVSGDPMGISTKFWTSQTTALQFSIAWREEDSFLGNRVSASGDYLWHSFDAIRSEYQFPIFYGVGGELVSGGIERDMLGIRGVLGIEFLPRKIPMDVFLQFVPVLVLTPGTSLDAQAGIGLRFFIH